MAQTSLVQVRLDEPFKREVDTLFADLGLDTPTAIRMFLKQAVKRHGLPFEVTQIAPNAETRAAIEEVREMKRNPHLYKGFKSVDALFEDLDDGE